MPQETAKKRVLLAKDKQVSIFRRGGWLCHWCRKAVIFPPVMKCIQIEVQKNGYTGPLAYYHRNWTRAMAPLLDELGAVLDHREAFSVGGQCIEENLVTACAKCNGRKSNALVEVWDKRPMRKPIKGKYGEPLEWDGLSELFVVLADRHFSDLTAGERAWLKAVKSKPAA